ncbi:Protein of unknown function (DUF3558) [Prauserella sp. Am3]|nr:Protein of unknown function (DUF3558) [Prauserella sp. Am3]
MRPTRAAYLPLVAVAVMTVAACSDGEAGTPETNGGPTSSAASPTTASPSTTDAASPLSGLDPCSLLSEADVNQFGPVDDPTRTQDDDMTDACAWEPDRSEESGERATLAVVLRENAGVQDMNDLGMGIQRTEENGRQYARVPDPNGCGIAIGVTETARVDVLATGVDPDKGCQVANTLTELVEPKVPQG